jgi:hypothetical protein
MSANAFALFGAIHLLHGVNYALTKDNALFQEEAWFSRKQFGDMRGCFRREQ